MPFILRFRFKVYTDCHSFICFPSSTHFSGMLWLWRYWACQNRFLSYLEYGRWRCRNWRPRIPCDIRRRSRHIGRFVLPRLAEYFWNDLIKARRDDKSHPEWFPTQHKEVREFEIFCKNTSHRSIICWYISHDYAPCQPHMIESLK